MLSKKLQVDSFLKGKEGKKVRGIMFLSKILIHLCMIIH